jgi:hypothetical protein
MTEVDYSKKMKNVLMGDECGRKMRVFSVANKNAR